jgi:hypothetical protein
VAPAGVREVAKLARSPARGRNLGPALWTRGGSCVIVRMGSTPCTRGSDQGLRRW